VPVSLSKEANLWITLPEVLPKAGKALVFLGVNLFSLYQLNIVEKKGTLV
jgi:hypothetical protein